MLYIYTYGSYKCYSSIQLYNLNLSSFITRDDYLIISLVLHVGGKVEWQLSGIGMHVCWMCFH